MKKICFACNSSLKKQGFLSQEWVKHDDDESRRCKTCIANGVQIVESGGGGGGGGGSGGRNVQENMISRSKRSNPRSNYQPAEDTSANNSNVQKLLQDQIEQVKKDLENTPKFNSNPSFVSQAPSSVPQAPYLAPQWSCDIGNNQFVDYDDAVNDMINKAYGSKTRCTFTIKGQSYYINWNNMTQVNMTTRVERKISSKQQFQNSLNPRGMSQQGNTTNNGSTINKAYQILTQKLTSLQDQLQKEVLKNQKVEIALRSDILNFSHSLNDDDDNDFSCFLVMLKKHDNLKQKLNYMNDDKLQNMILSIVNMNNSRNVPDDRILKNIDKRVLSLLNKKDYYGCKNMILKTPPKANNKEEEDNIQNALHAICSLQLGDSATEIVFPNKGNEKKWKMNNPFWLLAYALKKQKEGEGGEQSSMNKRKAYDFALISLINPNLYLIPHCVELAKSIIIDCDDIFNNRTQQSKASSSKDSDSNSPDSIMKKRAGKNVALKQLTSLVGLKEVKDKFLALQDRVAFSKETNEDITTKQYNVMFTGNPGTGKTTVARIYGSLLKELGVLHEDTFEETTGAKLLSGGMSLIKEILEKLHDDGVSPLADGEKVETDHDKKNEWIKGKIQQTNKDGTMDIKYSNKNGTIIKNVKRDRIRSLEKTGVLFLDEAYQLQPTKNQIGAQILDYLLTEMEEWRGKLVVIFAGYKEPLEDLLKHNEGLPSRFNGTYNFEDFTDDELCEVLTRKMNEKKNYKKTDSKYYRIASKRLGKQRSTVGFGNARAVRNLVEQIEDRHAERIIAERNLGGNPDKFQITRDDVLGRKAGNNFKSKAYDKLKTKIGLNEIKQTMKTFIKLVEANEEAEEQEKKTQEILLNRVFVGNPGTGKTITAKLYGEILHDLGFLSKGDLIVKNPSDFIGSALGQSEEKTKAILASSVGCVLLIDEAYGLNPSSGGSLSNGKCPYKTAVIDTIVAEVQGVPGDDRCVLLCGYTNEMDDLMRNANPGLLRRFPDNNRFVFKDYNDSELYQILQLMAKEKELIVGTDAANAAIKLLSQMRMKPNFGNGGDVATLLSTAATKYIERTSRAPSSSSSESRQLLPCDFVPIEKDVESKERKRNPVSIFDDLVGCDGIKEQIKDLVAIIEDARANGRDPLDDIELNFKFVGPPGTGKTTVAQRMGLLFESLGLIASNDTFVECSVSDLQGSFVGQTAPKTREKFNQAKGGVLFIDEAYQLYDPNGSSYLNECVGEIVKMLTEDQFKGKMIVIFAGYEDQINEMMANVNPGLSSRVTRTIKFDKFDNFTTAEIVKKLLKEKNKELDEESYQFLIEIAKQLVILPNFGNGRDIETWVRRMVLECAKSKTSKVSKDIIFASFGEIIANLMQTAAAAATASFATSFSQPPTNMRFSQENQAPPPPPTVVKVADPVVKVKEEVAYDNGGNDDGDNEDERIKAALQKACVDLGYDVDLESRQKLEKVLIAIENGALFPKDIMDYVRKEARNVSDEKIDEVLRPQVSSIRRSTAAAIKYELAEIARLKELAEAERQKAKALEAKIQRHLMGKCPAGFSWHREGDGWRCGGGAHWVPNSDVPQS
jgi:SpoVK/Ycf46/Vps4 family AAA+-type ATPase